MREAAGDHEDEHMQGDDVDEEHIATPRRHLEKAKPPPLILHLSH